MSGLSRVIVGLGNPGAEYTSTRHNIGWRVVEHLAERRGLTDWKEGHLNAALLRDGGTLLVKPLTYMNHSGQAVQQVLRYYKIDPKALLVVSDDVDLPFGTLRARKSGGSGGQKGLANIIEIVGTQDIPRLRFGIGRPTDRRTVTDYVLAPFRPDETDQLPALLDQAADQVEAHE